MKKNLLIIGLLALTLTACGAAHNEYDRSSLSIITPTGAPALAFYNYASASNFETNSNPQTGIIPLMVSGQKDVVVLPTNAGMQAIVNKGAQYKIAATVTFGNFYLISLGNDENNEMGADDTILLFQQNNVPDKIFHYVYGDALNAGIHYVDAVSDAAKAANAGWFADQEGNRIVPNYVLLAQPVLTNVLKNNAGYSVYANMQQKYKEKANNLPLFQASVFIKNSVEKEIADSFLESLKSDINSALENPALISEGLNKIEKPGDIYGIDATAAENVTKNNNGMCLGFEYARDNKEAIENFLKLFNMEGIDEKVYY